MAAFDHTVSKVGCSREFTPENYFSLNATTLAHIGRIIKEEFAHIVESLMTGGLTDANLRNVAKDLAVRTEAIMVDILIKNKETLFKIFRGFVEGSVIIVMV